MSPRAANAAANRPHRRPMRSTTWPTAWKGSPAPGRPAVRSSPLSASAGSPMAASAATSRSTCAMRRCHAGRPSPSTWSIRSMPRM
ncbi:hypothetical protein G6F21_014665 [Rhizopus arrhizus]|nr:hypothetical protein G6F21_014665 [Rhizopus arrhizus]